MRKPAYSPVVLAGHLRVHIGILPGCGQHEGLFEDIQQTLNAGGLVVRASPVPEGWPGSFPPMPPGFQPTANISDPALLATLLHLKPALVVIPTLNPLFGSAPEREAFFANLAQLLQAGLKVTATLDLVAVDLIADFLNPTYHWPEHARVPPTWLRLHVNDYVVHDLPPNLIQQRFYANKLPLPPHIAVQNLALNNLANLSRLRSALFGMVGAHVTDQVRATNPNLQEIKLRLSANSWQVYVQKLLATLGLLAIFIILLHQVWLRGYLSTSAVMLLLLGSVVTSNVTRSTFIPLLTTILGALALIYLFMEPYATLFISNPQDVLAIGTFVFIGSIACWLASAQRQHEASTYQATMHSMAILRLGHDLAQAENLDDVIALSLNNLMRTARLKGFVVLCPSMNDESSWQWYPATPLNQTEHSLLKQSLTNNHIQRATRNGQHIFIPLRLEQQTIGAIGVLTDTIGTLDLTQTSILFWRDYSNLMAGAIMRHQARAAQSSATHQAERESLRSTLLSAISHDLKTPLVSIIGGLSTLRHAGDGLPLADRQELLANAQTEAERLHAIIHNVLELTRLEAAGFTPALVDVDLVDTITDVANRFHHAQPGVSVTLECPDNLRIVQGDALLMGQVCQNIIENAARYAGPKCKISIKVKAPAPHTIAVSFTDNGPGLPAGSEEKIFDKFYRIEQADHRTAGSGLGLTICRLIARAHNGDITAANRADGHKGAVFTLTLPGEPTLSIKGA